VSTYRIKLLGAGIAGSLSPALHTHEAAALGLDLTYAPIDLDETGDDPADAGTVVRRAVAEGATALNVTHPCKRTVLDSLDNLSHAARMLGAVNTIVVDHGRLIGHNTDQTGFGSALRHGLPGAPLGRVVLIGAGGAGTAVAHALAAAGVRDLVVVDSDAARAGDVAGQVSGRAATPGDLGVLVAAADGVVNASPVGMVGHPGTPVDPALLHPGLWVADIVYRPLVTELLAAADRLGCRTLNGGQMLVAQAADSFALFTGTAPDRERMRRHLDELLAARAAAS
jgi:shikimate dehydrogenase